MMWTPLVSCHFACLILLPSHVLWLMVHPRRAVSYQEGEKFAEDNGLMFLETSARTGENVNQAFVRTAEKIYDHIKKGIYDPNNDVSPIKHLTRIA